VEPWLSPLVVVASAVSVVAVVRVRDRIHRQRVEKAAHEDMAVSVVSRLADHSLVSSDSDTNIGTAHDRLDETIMAILATEPNVYTKTALAKQVGSGYANVLKRITALQDEGRVVPNARGAKLSLAAVRQSASGG
jgi:hypothetical protein